MTKLSFTSFFGGTSAKKKAHTISAILRIVSPCLFCFSLFECISNSPVIRSAAGYTCSSWDCVGLNSFSTSPALSRTSPILSSTHNSRVSKNLLLVLLLVLVLKTKRLCKWASRRNSVGSPFPEHLLAPGIINFQAAYNYAHIG